MKAKESHVNYPNPRELKITYACMAQNANDVKIDQSKWKTQVKIHNSEGRIIDNLPKYTSLLQFGHFGIFDWNKNVRFGMASEAF